MDRLQPTPWPYVTWDLNVQLCYWPVYASNRLHLGESLLDTLDRNRQAMIENVRPVEWQDDSAILPISTALDLIEPAIDGDVDIIDEEGNNLDYEMSAGAYEIDVDEGEAVTLYAGDEPPSVDVSHVSSPGDGRSSFAFPVK